MGKNMRDNFSTFEICKAFNFSHERLRQWMKLGFIEPETPAQGQGTRAEFSRFDAYKVGLFDSLLKRGFKRERASKYINIYTYLAQREDVKFIVADSALNNGMQEIETSNFENLEDALKEIKKNIDCWEQIHIINFNQLRKRVDEALSIL